MCAGPAARGGISRTTLLSAGRPPTSTSYAGPAPAPGRVLAVLRGEARERAGRRPRSTAAVVDSSSVKGTPVPGPRGFDGAKKVDGIKRHILVDTTGALLGCHVTPAD